MWLGYYHNPFAFLLGIYLILFVGEFLVNSEWMNYFHGIIFLTHKNLDNGAFENLNLLHIINSTESWTCGNFKSLIRYEIFSKANIYCWAIWNMANIKFINIWFSFIKICEGRLNSARLLQVWLILYWKMKITWQSQK